MTAKRIPHRKISLLSQHQKLIQESGISTAVAAARGYQSVTDRRDLLKLGFPSFQASVPALLIPVRTVTGQVAFRQTRPDKPRTRNGKSVKYETPAGARMVLDVPPGALLKIGDASEPLFITEGIRKADSAVSRGLCCIALLGVDCWGGHAERDWDAIALKGRNAFIAFDSDVMRNPAVRSALIRLGKFLERRGAKVFPIFLPPGPGGAKVGLDDFFAAGHSVDELLKYASPDAAPPREAQAKGRTLSLRAVEPWPNPVDGALLLEDLVAEIESHVVLPHHAGDALALWVLHAHAIEAFDTSPRLFLTSPTKQCGKTRVLDVLRRLVTRPFATSNLTSAVLFRIVERKPTILVDEFDRLDLDAKKEIIGIINAGWERGGVVHRMVGDPSSYQVTEFPCFAPMAIAAIGRTVDTIQDRSIVFTLTRKPRTHKVQRLRAGKTSPLDELARKAARWVVDNLETLRGAVDPTFPDSLDDRGCDKWEPLFKIANAVGGDWPSRVRRAAVALSGSISVEDDSAGVRLLADIQCIFKDRNTAKLASGELCTALAKVEDSDWAEWRYGRPLSKCQLAGILRDFNVRSKNVRIGDKVRKGYEACDFQTAFEAFLPAGKRYSATSAVLTVPGAFTGSNGDPLRAEGVANSKSPNGTPLGPSNGKGSGVAGIAVEEPRRMNVRARLTRRADSGGPP